MSLGKLRQDYHRQLYEQVFSTSLNCQRSSNSPGFTAGTKRTRSDIAGGIVRRLESFDASIPLLDRSVGTEFRKLTASFIEGGIQLVRRERHVKWVYSTGSSIPQFGQYAHLQDLERFEKMSLDPRLQSVLGDGYILWPDIIIGRMPVDEGETGSFREILEHDVRSAGKTTLKESDAVGARPLLHASVSCNWTIQGKHFQGSRSEAMNLVRDALGRIPHIAVVTAEPLPTRLAAIALGTGDVDCVYHFALHELRAAIEEIDNEDQMDMLKIMLEGKRLRDISDLPFDLAT